MNNIKELLLKLDNLKLKYQIIFQKIISSHLALHRIRIIKECIHEEIAKAELILQNKIVKTESLNLFIYRGNESYVKINGINIKISDSINFLPSKVAWPIETDDNLKSFLIDSNSSLKTWDTFEIKIKIINNQLDDESKNLLDEINKINKMVYNSTLEISDVSMSYPVDIKELDDEFKSLVNYYFAACEKFKVIYPSLDKLVKISNGRFTKSIWASRLKEGAILILLHEKCEKKIHYAKNSDKRTFWIQVDQEISSSMERLANKKQINREVRRNDDNYSEIDDPSKEYNN